MVAESLNVYLHDDLIGTVAADPRDIRRVTFRTASEFTGAPMGLTEAFSLFPGSEVDGTRASRFLGGYLPEGQNRGQLAARIPRLSPTDLFGMLKHYGVTMAGAVSVRTDDPADDISPDYRVLSSRDLKQKLQKAVREHDLGSEPGSGRSAIAGFQPKILLAKFDGEWFQPLHSAHSTHIVKPAPAHRPVTIADEFYSHELARSMGLTKFDSELTTVNGLQYLAIERYDRKVRGYGDVENFHQEDAAQALALDWVESKAKFQDPDSPARADRPSAARVAELAGTLGQADGAEIWLQYLIYAVLVGNHDAHAKNVSVVHDGAKSSLADLYDAVPILHINDDPDRKAADRIRDELALAIGGEFSHHAVTREHFQAEAEGWGALASRRIRAVIDRTFESFGNALDSVKPPSESTPKLKDRLGYNLDRLAAGQSIGRPKLPIPARSIKKTGDGGALTAGQPRAKDLGALKNGGEYAKKIHSYPEAPLTKG